MHTTAFFEKSEVLVWQPKKSARNWKKRLCLEDQKKTRKKNRQNDEFFCEHEKLEKKSVHATENSLCGSNILHALYGIQSFCLF